MSDERVHSRALVGSDRNARGVRELPLRELPLHELPLLGTGVSPASRGSSDHLAVRGLIVLP